MRANPLRFVDIQVAARYRALVAIKELSRWCERWRMHYVTDASYTGDYKLKIRFENEEVRLVDLRGHLDGPIFQPLRDLSYFAKFEVNRDIDTVVWPNGADFSPDFLYEISQPIREVLHSAGSA